MKVYLINDNANEKIELKVDDGKYALVQLIKSPSNNFPDIKTIVMNRREALTLYQALQEDILNKKEGR